MTRAGARLCLKLYFPLFEINYTKKIGHNFFLQFSGSERNDYFLYCSRKRHEKSLKDLEAKQTSHREGIGKLQQQYQQLMVKAQQK